MDRSGNIKSVKKNKEKYENIENFFFRLLHILFMIRYQISLSSFYTYSLSRNTSFHYDEIIIRKSTKKFILKFI